MTKQLWLMYSHGKFGVCGGGAGWGGTREIVKVREIWKKFLQQQNLLLAGLNANRIGERNPIINAVTVILKLHTHREAFGLSRSESSLLSLLMMMFVVSLKIQFPIRGQMLKISKIICTFSRLCNRNIMISTASPFTLSCFLSDFVSSRHAFDSLCSSYTGLLAGP